MKVTPARPAAQAIEAIERYAAADQIASRASRVVRDASQRDASSVDEKVKALRQAKSVLGAAASASVPPSSSSGAHTLQHGSAVNSSTGSNSSDDQHIKALKELLARGDITAAQFNDAVVVAAAQAHAPTGGELASRSRFFASSRPWLLQSFVGPDERRRVDRILRETAEAAAEDGGAGGAGGGDEFQALRYLREFKSVDAAGGALRESLGWRRAVMEPLLRAPAGVMDQLMTERIWLLPQPNRRGNPVIVFNAAKAIAHPTPAQQQEMVLATLFVLEKAVSCSDNPLVEVDIVMNRTRADDAADMGGKQGLAMITGLRGRFELLGKMLRLHYPGRIGSCSIFPPGPIVRLGVRMLQGLGVSFGFDVQVRDPGAMREFFGAAMLPTELGGDAPYSFALSDVMLPLMKLQDYSSVALHFDDAEMERKYGAWVQRSFCALRPRAILGVAEVAVADGWMRRKRSAALEQQQQQHQQQPCGHVSNGDVLLLLGLWALYYVVARRVFRDAALRRWDGAASVAFAVLLQVPALQRFVRLTGGECASSDEQLSAERCHEQSTFALAVFGWAACIAPLRVSKGMSAVLAAWACWVLPALAGGHAASDVHGMSIGGYHAAFGLLLLATAGLLTWGRERVAREHFRTLNRQSQALAAAQEELNSLRAQTRSTPLVCVDTDLRVTVWNSAMAELTGWHSRDVVGLDFVDELVGHEARGAVRRRLGVLLSQPQDSAATLELPVLTHAGATRSSGAGARHGKMDAAPTAAGADGRGAGEREISLLCNIASRVNGAGVAHGVTILAQDITERVRLENARKNFVSSFSHELRTPLAGVMGMLELLSVQPLSCEAQRFIHKAQISSNLLLNLVNDILDMSRIEAGKMELAARPFRIKRALLQTVDLVKYQAEMKGLKVAVSLKGRVPDAVVGDVMRFRQVLLNLLSNAVKFTVKGSIAVRVSCDFVEEASEASEGGVKLRVRVRDTGIGIQPASLPALFSMFSKVDTDNALVNNASGCGLGLAISSRLVRLMGGEVSVTSTPGSGSSFVFTVLCKPAPREFGGGGGGSGGGGSGGGGSGGSGAGAGTGSSSGLHSTTGSGSASDIADAELDEAEANAVLEDLDFADGTSAGALRRARHAAQVCRGKRVLLAEDNAFNAEIITAYLTAAAVEVVWASNGEQAVRAFKAAVLEEGRPFDCVLMDCQVLTSAFSAFYLLATHSPTCFPSHFSTYADGLPDADRGRLGGDAGAPPLGGRPCAGGGGGGGRGAPWWQRRSTRRDDGDVGQCRGGRLGCSRRRRRRSSGGGGGGGGGGWHSRKQQQQQQRAPHAHRGPHSVRDGERQSPLPRRRDGRGGDEARAAGGAHQGHRAPAPGRGRRGFGQRQRGLAQRRSRGAAAAAAAAAAGVVHLHVRCRPHRVAERAHARAGRRQQQQPVVGRRRRQFFRRCLQRCPHRHHAQQVADVFLLAAWQRQQRGLDAQVARENPGRCRRRWCRWRGARRQRQPRCPVCYLRRVRPGGARGWRRRRRWQRHAQLPAGHHRPPAGGELPAHRRGARAVAVRLVACGVLQDDVQVRSRVPTTGLRRHLHCRGRPRRHLAAHGGALAQGQRRVRRRVGAE